MEYTKDQISSHEGYNDYADYMYDIGLNKLNNEVYRDSLEKFYTENYKNKNEKKIYPRDYMIPRSLECTSCQENKFKNYLEKNDVQKSISELEKKNQLMTIFIIVLAVYCIMQFITNNMTYMTRQIQATLQPMKNNIPSI
jgi:hypothetical protein